MKRRRTDAFQPPQQQLQHQPHLRLAAGRQHQQDESIDSASLSMGFFWLSASVSLFLFVVTVPVAAIIWRNVDKISSAPIKSGAFFGGGVGCLISSILLALFGAVVVMHGHQRQQQPLQLSASAGFLSRAGAALFVAFTLFVCSLPLLRRGNEGLTALFDATQQPTAEAAAGSIDDDDEEQQLHDGENVNNFSSTQTGLAVAFSMAIVLVGSVVCVLGAMMFFNIAPVS